LVTGSLPTEKLPEKSHDIPKRERRTLQRRQTFDTLGNQPSTSSGPSQKSFDIDDLNRQVQKTSIYPWLTSKLNEEEVRLELFDECPKYTVTENSTLEFSIIDTLGNLHRTVETEDLRLPNHL